MDDPKNLSNHPLAVEVGGEIRFRDRQGELYPTLRQALEADGRIEKADRGIDDCYRSLDDPRFFGGGGPLGGDPAGGGR